MEARLIKQRLIQELFVEEINRPEEQMDLAYAVLLIAQWEYTNVDIKLYLRRLDEMAMVIAARLQRCSIKQTLEEINSYLYEELSFRGNKDNYYDPRNSFLNEVIDRRLGIPITLSIIYMEIAKRLKLNFVGVGMPGHFLIKCCDHEEELILDAFNNGQRLTVTECQQLWANIYGRETPWQSSCLRTVTKREILIRVLNNLKSIYISGGDNARALNIIDYLLLLNPDSLVDLKERGLINLQLQRFYPATKDLELYLLQVPAGPEKENVKQYLIRAKLEMATLN